MLITLFFTNLRIEYILPSQELLEIVLEVKDFVKSSLLIDLLVVTNLAIDYYYHFLPIAFLNVIYLPHPL